MITELDLYPIDAQVGDLAYQHFHLFIGNDHALLVNTKGVAVYDEGLVAADRTGNRVWTVVTLSGTWTITDSHGCGCGGSRVVPTGPS